MKKKILVVDDEQEIVDFLESFLDRFKVTVIKATRGAAALQCYKQESPDFVFLDIKMPDMDGISVLTELKAEDPKVKVIMITGQEDEQYQQKAKQIGALDYITKPLDLGELRAKIEKYMS